MWIENKAFGLCTMLIILTSSSQHRTYFLFILFFLVFLEFILFIKQRKITKILWISEKSYEESYVKWKSHTILRLYWKLVEGRLWHGCCDWLDSYWKDESRASRVYGFLKSLLVLWFFCLTRHGHSTWMLHGLLWRVC